MQQRVLVVGRDRRPLMPCSPARARMLLKAGRAAILRRYPFTIMLRDREGGDVQPVAVKCDPGSETTGMALVAEFGRRGRTVVWAAEIQHRGKQVRKALTERRALRRARRNRKTRYRKPRFLNRNPQKCAGCGKNAKHGSRYCRKCGERPKDNGYRDTRLLPSLRARVDQVMNALKKLCVPIGRISMELVRFDTQKLQNPEIEGVEYQHGTLFGYEVKEYLLQKFGHRCTYCGGESGDPVLEVEHVVPRSRGGTNRVSNLVIACRTCNVEKGNLQPVEWQETLGKSRRKLDRVRSVNLLKALVQLKVPLKDAAAVNATRWVLYRRLLSLGFSVEVGSGGRTKHNRERMELPKEHYWDAACVGESSPERFRNIPAWVQAWEAKGRGTRKMCNTDAHGFPVSRRERKKMHFGFQTGDMVVADVPMGKYAGRWIGRVAVRASGYFDLKDSAGKRVCQGISHRHMKLLQRADGWQYEKKTTAG